MTNFSSKIYFLLVFMVLFMLNILTNNIFASTGAQYTRTLTFEETNSADMSIKINADLTTNTITTMWIEFGSDEPNRNLVGNALTSPNIVSLSLTKGSASPLTIPITDTSSINNYEGKEVKLRAQANVDPNSSTQLYKLTIKHLTTTSDEDWNLTLSNLPVGGATPLRTMIYIDQGWFSNLNPVARCEGLSKGTQYTRILTFKETNSADMSIKINADLTTNTITTMWIEFGSDEPNGNLVGNALTSPNIVSLSLTKGSASPLTIPITDTSSINNYEGKEVKLRAQANVDLNSSTQLYKLTIKHMATTSDEDWNLTFSNLPVGGATPLRTMIYIVQGWFSALTPAARCVVDTDGDGVPEPFDQCPGHDDNIDFDNDGIPDGCDNDRDGDGVPNNADQCDGHDDNIDTDGDGIPDGCELIVCIRCMTEYKFKWFLVIPPEEIKPGVPIGPICTTCPFEWSKDILENVVRGAISFKPVDGKGYYIGKGQADKIKLDINNAELVGPLFDNQNGEYIQVIDYQKGASPSVKISVGGFTSKEIQVGEPSNLSMNILGFILALCLIVIGFLLRQIQQIKRRKG